MNIEKTPAWKHEMMNIRFINVEERDKALEIVERELAQKESGISALRQYLNERPGITPESKPFLLYD